MGSRIEIVGRVSGRRRWTVEQKLLMLGEAFGPDGSVREAMRRYEVGSNLLYLWRRQAISGALGGTAGGLQARFVEVAIREPAMLPAPSPAAGTGQIGIDLPSGVRITVDGSVDAEALSRVIGVLTR